MKTLLNAAVILLLASPAHAHSGPHDDLNGWQEVASHFAGSPFHIGLLLAVAGGLLAATAVHARAGRKQPKRDTSRRR